MNRTNYIFIDFENVHETDWNRIVGKPVKVTVVMGEQHKYIPVGTVKVMLKCASQVQLIETKRTGKNAADFVLAQLISEQKKSDPDGFFHIISNDKGFDALIEHLKQNDILAARRASFRAIPILMDAAERTHYLATFYKKNTETRAGKQKTLESQIQAMFGKALSPEDLAATIGSLVAAKIITIADDGKVTY